MWNAFFAIRLCIFKSSDSHSPTTWAGTFCATFTSEHCILTPSIPSAEATENTSCFCFPKPLGKTPSSYLFSLGTMWEYGLKGCPLPAGAEDLLRICGGSLPYIPSSFITTSSAPPWNGHPGLFPHKNTISVSCEMSGGLSSLTLSFRFSPNCPKTYSQATVDHWAYFHIFCE